MSGIEGSQEDKMTEIQGDESRRLGVSSTVVPLWGGHLHDRPLDTTLDINNPLSQLSFTSPFLKL